MTNLKCKFKLFRGPEWKFSRHKFGPQSTICGPLTRVYAGEGVLVEPPFELAFLRNNFYYLLKEDQLFSCTFCSLICRLNANTTQ